MEGLPPRHIAQSAHGAPKTPSIAFRCRSRGARCATVARTERKARLAACQVRALRADKVPKLTRVGPPADRRSARAAHAAGRQGECPHARGAARADGRRRVGHALQKKMAERRPRGALGALRPKRSPETLLQPPIPTSSRGRAVTQTITRSFAARRAPSPRGHGPAPFQLRRFTDSRSKPNTIRKNGKVIWDTKIRARRARGEEYAARHLAALTA